MNTKSVNNLVTFAENITPLGVCLRVTYVPATNCRPSRWKAEINEGRHNVKAFAPYGHSTSEDGQGGAVEKCLSKWVATFSEEARPKSIQVHSKGFEDNSDLYFFTVTR
jgi:hypothetical protein